MIKLSKVYKSFDKRVVLSDVSLTVSKNEFVCITGESGAGKTTLLNLIGLLDKPDSGEVSINDKIHFTSKEILKLRRNFFGYVFQDYLLMNDKTVQENINISKDIFKYENRKSEEKDILTPFLGKLNEFMGSIREKVLKEYDTEAERKKAFEAIINSAVKEKKLPDNGSL